MDERKFHLQSDLDADPDNTVYEISFYVDSEDGLQLYETLKTDSPPMIPDVGSFVSFNFVTEDETGDEVFRSDQGEIPSSEVSSEGDYTKKYTGDLEVVSVDTSYEKCVTDIDGQKTKIIKTVKLEQP